MRSARPFPRRAPQSTGPVDTWRMQAVCRPGVDGRPTPDVFFAENDPVMVQWALEACAVCPVRRECLTAAMATEGHSQSTRYGIYGGFTSRERQNLHRRAERGTRPLTELIARAVSWPLPDLGDVLDAHTEELADGHSRWTLRSTSIAIGGTVYTPAQLAFTVGHDRDPIGRVQAACQVRGCITPDHLTDEKLRRARRRARPRSRAVAA